MKKNVLGLAAVVFAIAASSFTVKKATNFYLVYNGAGVEKSMSSYATPTTAQPTHLSGIGAINWFRVTAASSTTVTTAEFNIAFDSYDVVNPGSDLLSDETIDVPNQMDLKAD